MKKTTEYQILDSALAKNDSSAIVDALNNLGEKASRMQNYETARLIYHETFAIALRNNNRNGIGRCNSNLGNLHLYYLSDFSGAHEFFLEALKIAEELDNQQEIATNYNNIGNVHFFLFEFDKALELYRKALLISQKSDPQKDNHRILNNIALVYSVTGKSDSALYLHHQILENAIRVNDKKIIANAHLNLGDYEYNRGNSEKAIPYYKKAIAIYKTTDDPIGLAMSYNHLSALYNRDSQFRSAEAYLDSSFEISARIGSRAMLLNNYDKLSIILYNQEKYKEAMDLYRQYYPLRDSLFNEKRTAQIAEMQTRFETEKKETENKLLRSEATVKQLEINRQRAIRNFSIVISVLLIITILVIYSRFRLKEQSNRLLSSKNEQLQILNATKDRFFSIIAHDLRNPMGPLVSLTDYLAGDYQNIGEPKKEKMFLTIHKSVITLNNLLENLLKWVLSQLDKLEVTPKNIRLFQIIDEVKNELETETDKKQIRLEILINEDLQAWTDPVIVSVILRNLVHNAIKFSPEQSVVRIKTGEENEKYISISVQDQGCGIEKADIEKLFRIESDHRKIGNPQNKGTGLGLIVCSELVKKSGGEIFVDSEPGKGSIFTFTLPKSSENE